MMSPLLGILKSHLETDIERHLVAGHEGGRELVGQHLFHRTLLDDAAHADQGAQHADVEHHRVAGSQTGAKGRVAIPKGKGGTADDHAHAPGHQAVLLLQPGGAALAADEGLIEGMREKIRDEDLPMP